MSLARIAHTKKKSLHTFDEEPFFINCKNLCHYRNMLSIIFFACLTFISTPPFSSLTSAGVNSVEKIKSK